MNSKWWFRFSFLIVVTTIAAMFVMPTIFDFKEDSKFPIKSKINLGLDLQGGLYMVLGIDFNKVYKEEVTNYVKKSIAILKDEGLSAELGDQDLSDLRDPKRDLVLINPADAEKAKEVIRDYYRGGSLRLTLEEGGKLTYGMHRELRRQIEEESLTKSIEVIRNRIDEFGVTEPEITSQGEDRIVVQLPGVRDIERAKDLIGKTAKLEFKMVNADIAGATLMEWVAKAKKEKEIEFKKGDKLSDYIDALNEFLIKDMPKGFELAFERGPQVDKDTPNLIPYLVQENSSLSGEDLQDARAQVNPEKNEPYVSLDFKPRGAKLFADLTEKNVGKLMAIVLDGNVYSAPRINERIGGGRAQITLGAGGNFQKQMKEASDLSLVLRAGALPVQLEFQEQRIVGPQLGHDSIAAAEKASLIGCIAVFLFILVYYKVSGFIALTTLSLNILFVLAALVGFEATLTLPGIAGIALTIGMAIDASIIIYERIREEVRAGENNFRAVEKGFGQAFWTILDANITTALAGFCLLNFGTGPVRGFAVTLLIGIVATVYTAYFVGNLLFTLYMNKVEGKDLSI